MSKVRLFLPLVLVALLAPEGASAAEPAAEEPAPDSTASAPSPESTAAGPARLVPCVARASTHGKRATPWLTVGNTWERRETRGRHGEVWKERRVRLTVAATGRIGGFDVALVEQATSEVAGLGDPAAGRIGPPETARWARVSRGKGAWKVPCLDALPADTASLRAALARCGERVRTERGRKDVKVRCFNAGCVATEHLYAATSGSGWSGDAERWWLPALGTVASGEGEYSAETGDGSTENVHLLSFRVALPPFRKITVEPEPKAAARVRSKLHELAQKGDAAALESLLADDVVFSLHTGHRGASEAVEAWKGDGGLAMKALADVLSEPCLLARDRRDFVACPAPFARRIEALSQSCGVEGVVSRPRATLELRNGKWVLSALLLGGVDDYYTESESSSHPPVPVSLRERLH